jgi:hypothetical protein
VSGKQGRREGRRAPPDLHTLISLGSPWSSDGGTGRREASSEGWRGGEENEWEARVGGLRRTGGVLCKTAQDHGLISVFIKGFFAR